MHQTPKTILAVVLGLLVLACGGVRTQEGPLIPVTASRVFLVEALQISGDPANRINLVVLGDGYTSKDQVKLTQDARAWLRAFTGTTPYGRYAGYFNVQLVHVVSHEDGATNGMYGLSVTRDTALGATFQNAAPAGQPPDFRLLVVNNAAAQAVAVAHVPECTKVLVLVNDVNYGGSGGIVPVFSANPDSGLIALHELGHSFGGLADEYACGDTSPLDEGALATFPNVTTQQNLDLIKWKDWIAPGLPLPTPDTGEHAAQLGLFEGAFYHNGGAYRPRHACRMRSLNDSFCEVCSEAIVHGVYDRVSPIDSASPASPVQVAAGAFQHFSISHPVPQPNTLQVFWTVDGMPVTGDGDAMVLSGVGLSPGPHAVSVHLVDATTLVRRGRERLEQVHTWTVNAVGSAPATAPLTVRPRESHQLLRVIRDATGFRVVDRQIVDLPLPPRPNLDASAWLIEARGPNGQSLFSVSVEDPTQLRGEFHNGTDPGQIDGTRHRTNGSTSFLLRLPRFEFHHLDISGRTQGNGGGRIRFGAAPLVVP